MHMNGVKRLLGEHHFSTRGAVQMISQWKSVAVDHQHPLRTLSLLGQADFVPAFPRRREGAIEKGHTPVELTLLV
jgi:hypothetical protein